MASSLGQLGTTGALSAVDFLAGAAIGSLVDMVSPPVENQGAVRMGVEGLLQMIAVMFLGLETSKLIHTTNPDPTRGVPFILGAFLGTTNTIAKLGIFTSMMKGHLKNAAYSPVSAAAPAPVPESDAQ
jgi:hypothetical protein